MKNRVAGGGSYFASPNTSIEFIPSGSMLLDLALGGGWAESRISNIIGDKAVGKTLMCIEAAANFVKKHPKAIVRYREAEAAFDKPYAGALGMPLKHVDFGEPIETIEDMFEDLGCVIEASNGPELYILDSLDALSDRAELGRDMDAGTFGAEKAKKLSQVFRRLTSHMATANVTLMIVSQVRSKIGMSFGRTTSRSGGRALDFYSSQVIFLSQLPTKPTKTVSGIKRPTGIAVRAKIDKNKVGLPYREAEFEITFGYGIDDTLACLRWLDEVGALSDVDVASTSKIKGYVRDLAKLPDDKYWEEIAFLHEVVKWKWYEVEKAFVPRRRKYGGQ